MPSPTTPFQFSSEEYQQSLQELWARANRFDSSQDTLVNDLEPKTLPPQPTQSPHEESEKEVLLGPSQSPLPTQPPHEETEKEVVLEPSRSPLPTQLQYEEAEKELLLEPFQPTLPTQSPHAEAEKESPLGVVFPPNLRLDIPAEPHIMNPRSGIPWCPTPDNEKALHDKLIIGVDVQVFLPKVHRDAPARAFMMDPDIPYPDILKDPVTGILWYTTSDNDHQHDEVIPGANFLPRIYGPLSYQIPVTELVDYPHVLIHSATGINWVPAPYAYYQWRITSPQNYPFYASSIAPTSSMASTSTGLPSPISSLVSISSPASASTSTITSQPEPSGAWPTYGLSTDRTSSLVSTPTALNPTALTSPASSLVSALSSASTSAITSQPQPPGASSTYEPSIDRTSSLVSASTVRNSGSTSGIVHTSSSASTSSSSSTSTIKAQREQESTDELSIASTSSPVSPSTERSVATTSSSESTSTITREMERYALIEFKISTAPFHALKTRLFSRERPPSSAPSSRAPSLRSTSPSKITSQPQGAWPTSAASVVSTLSPDLTSTASSLERKLSSASTISSASISTIQREREREFTYDPSLVRSSSLSSASTTSSTRKKKSFAQKYIPDRYYRGWKYRASGSDPRWLLPEEDRGGTYKPSADLK